MRAQYYFCAIVSFLFFGSELNGQGHDGLFGNEWISHSQTYYKVQLAEDGMYRIYASDLTRVGFNLSNLNTNNLQVFNLGQEVPIQVSLDGSGQLDYVQFYGTKNRGDFDVHFYPDKNWHFNKEYSVVTDTAAYFLTVSSGVNGKRYANKNSNFNSIPSPESYFIDQKKVVYSSNVSFGKKYLVDNTNIYKSIFEYGEGWCSAAAKSHTINITANYPNSNGPQANLSVRSYLRQKQNRTLTLKANGSNILSKQLGYKDTVSSFGGDFSASNLLSGTNQFRIESSTSGDNFYISHATLNYPRNFQFDGERIYNLKLSASPNKRFLELSGFDATNSNSQKYYLYDLNTQERIKCFWVVNRGKLWATLDGSANERNLIVVNEGNIQSTLRLSNVKKVQFADYGSAAYRAYDYVILTTPDLRNITNGVDPIEDYKNFRTNEGNTPVVIDMQAVYDQFGYGINTHPISVRHFSNFISKNWTNAEYLFLIGKGISYFSRVNGKLMRTSSRTTLQKIPTIGYPSSDNLMVTIAPNSTKLCMAVGRLAARTSNDVWIYLQKMKKHSLSRKLGSCAFYDRNWLHNVLHLGGGGNSSEQKSIKTNLNRMKSYVERPSLGANVYSFFKNSTNPIQAAQSTFLDSLINSGVSMITFYGHSSPNSFDFSLDDPSNYKNKDRYPLVVALGCYGGNVFEQTTFISEDFIFEPEAGAGAFLAPNGPGALGALGQFSEEMYKNIGQLSYNKGIGKVLQQTIETKSNTYASNELVMIMEQMCLHGDPAFKVTAGDAPDYYTDISNVRHYPELVTEQLGSFDLIVDIFNLGMTVDSMIKVLVTDLNGNFIASTMVQANTYKTTVTIPIPLSPGSSGLKNYNIYLDADSIVAESPLPCAEVDNNQIIGYEVQVLSEAIIPVYPYEFSIINDTSFSLKASTGITFGPRTDYIIQFDTSELFTTPLQTTKVFNQTGLIEWHPNCNNLLDSTVYYWRITQDTLNQAPAWAYSSFIYLKGKTPGWNQSHFYQHKHDPIYNMTYEDNDRTYKYVSALQEVNMTSKLMQSSSDNEDVALYINGSRINWCRCRNVNGIRLVVINPETGREMNLNFLTQYGTSWCERLTPPFVFDMTNTTGQSALETFLKNDVPTGHFVMLTSQNNPHAHLWPPSLITYLKQQGAFHIDDLVTQSNSSVGPQYGFFYKKDDTSYVHKKSTITATPYDALDFVGLMEGSWYSGSQVSTRIGPALRWGKLEWNHVFDSGIDSSFVNIYGINSQGQKSLILPKITAKDTQLDQIIDAKTYPYLELEWKSVDSIEYTPAQLNYWRVYADMVPEAALMPSITTSLLNDTILYGAPIEFETSMKNISALDMDSMLVRFHVLGSQIDLRIRMAELLADSTKPVKISLPSIDLAPRRHQLLIEINPDNDQPEKYHFNNIGLIGFNVNTDVTNPLLDVTFDGVHIMNKDIVSGKPVIEIQLTDENPYLGLDKLEDFKIILRHPQYPSGEIALSASNTDMEFIPAQAGRLDKENKARIILRPILEFDGFYTLFVSGADRSGNNSGSLDYNVEFEVINKATVSNLLTYPNPFTSSTQFVFTLTGNELPDDLRIQIMTVTGRVVREIMMDELGPIRVGLNRTEFKWDGTDSYGDQLANGVYLYRVMTRKNGQQYENRYNRTDYMFKPRYW